MFKKLVSNLPFNPSLIGQLSFYAQRVRRESVVRRAGLIVLSLALVLQVFAVVSPPQSSLASSSNDLITGGITSRDDAVWHCQKNTRNYKAIMAYYGVTCDDIANASTVTLKSTDYNKRLYSMGNLAYGKKGETPVNIPNVGTTYLRYLWSWDSGQSSTYKALSGTTASGLKFFILYNCGNLTFVGIPTPPKICEYNADLLAADKSCFEPCPVSGKENIPKTSSKCFEPCPYNRSIAASSPKCFEPCPVQGKAALPKTSTECFVPCPYNSGVSQNGTACKPCESSKTQQDLVACLRYSKTVSNITQNISNANNTTARAGDTLKYTLTTTNTGKASMKSFSVNENISDVLDYADVVDVAGASKNSDNILSWPAADIKAGQSLVRSFTVKIKSPIPSTPVSSSDAGHFDAAITNVYGNAVQVKLQTPVLKTTEVINNTLPNTGPGASLIAISLVAFGAAYLFARSRLILHELSIVRTDLRKPKGA